MKILLLYFPTILAFVVPILAAPPTTTTVNAQGTPVYIASGGREFRIAAPKAVPTLVYNCAAMPLICENVAAYANKHGGTGGDLGGYQKFYYDPDAADKHERRSTSCGCFKHDDCDTVTSKGKKTGQKITAIANSVGLTDFSASNKAIILAGPNPGLDAKAANGPPTLSSRVSISQVPGRFFKEGVVFSCDEFPAATFIEGGTGAETICATQSWQIFLGASGIRGSKAVNAGKWPLPPGSGQRAEQDWQAASHQALGRLFPLKRARNGVGRAGADMIYPFSFSTTVVPAVTKAYVVDARQVTQTINKRNAVPTTVVRETARTVAVDDEYLIRRDLDALDERAEPETTHLSQTSSRASAKTHTPSLSQSRNSTISGKISSTIIKSYTVRRPGSTTTNSTLATSMTPDELTTIASPRASTTINRFSSSQNNTILEGVTSNSGTTIASSRRASMSTTRSNLPSMTTKPSSTFSPAATPSQSSGPAVSSTFSPAATPSQSSVPAVSSGIGAASDAATALQKDPSSEKAKKDAKDQAHKALEAAIAAAALAAAGSPLAAAFDALIASLTSAAAAADAAAAATSEAAASEAATELEDALEEATKDNEKVEEESEKEEDDPEEDDPDSSQSGRSNSPSATKSSDTPKSPSSTASISSPPHSSSQSPSSSNSASPTFSRSSSQSPSSSNSASPTFSRSSSQSSSSTNSTSPSSSRSSSSSSAASATPSLCTLDDDISGIEDTEAGDPGTEIPLPDSAECIPLLGPRGTTEGCDSPVSASSTSSPPVASSSSSPPIPPNNSPPNPSSPPLASPTSKTSFSPKAPVNPNPPTYHIVPTDPPPPTRSFKPGDLASLLSDSLKPSPPPPPPAPPTPKQYKSNNDGSGLCSSIGSGTCKAAVSQYVDTYLYTARTSYIAGTDSSGADFAAGLLGSDSTWGCAAIFVCDDDDGGSGSDSAASYKRGMTGAQIKSAFDNFYTNDHANTCGSSYLDNGCHITANGCDGCEATVPCGALPAAVKGPEGVKCY